MALPMKFGERRAVAGRGARQRRRKAQRDVTRLPLEMQARRQRQEVYLEGLRAAERARMRRQRRTQERLGFKTRVGIAGFEADRQMPKGWFSELEGEPGAAAKRRLPPASEAVRAGRMSRAGEAYYRSIGIRVGTPHEQADREKFRLRMQARKEATKLKPKPVGTIRYVGPGGQRYTGPGPGMPQTPEQAQQYGRAMAAGIRRTQAARAQVRRRARPGVQELLGPPTQPPGPTGGPTARYEAPRLGGPARAPTPQQQQQTFRGAEGIAAGAGVLPPQQQAEAELNALYGIGGVPPSMRPVAPVGGLAAAMPPMAGPTPTVGAGPPVLTDQHIENIASRLGEIGIAAGPETPGMAPGAYRQPIQMPIAGQVMGIPGAYAGMDPSQAAAAENQRMAALARGYLTPQQAAQYQLGAQARAAGVPPVTPVPTATMPPVPVPQPIATAAEPGAVAPAPPIGALMPMSLQQVAGATPEQAQQRLAMLRQRAAALAPPPAVATAEATGAWGLTPSQRERERQQLELGGLTIKEKRKLIERMGKPGSPEYAETQAGFKQRYEGLEKRHPGYEMRVSDSDVNDMRELHNHVAALLREEADPHAAAMMLKTSKLWDEIRKIEDRAAEYESWLAAPARAVGGTVLDKANRREYHRLNAQLKQLIDRYAGAPAAQ